MCLCVGEEKVYEEECTYMSGNLDLCTTLYVWSNLLIAAGKKNNLFVSSLDQNNDTARDCVSQVTMQETPTWSSSSVQISDLILISSSYLNVSKILSSSSTRFD